MYLCLQLLLIKSRYFMIFPNLLTCSDFGEKKITTYVKFMLEAAFSWSPGAHFFPIIVKIEEDRKFCNKNN